MDALTKRREHRAGVFYRNGLFMFVVSDGDKIVGCGGADGELPTLASLVHASKDLIDWRADTELGRKLARLECEHFDAETAEIMERIALI